MRANDRDMLKEKGIFEVPEYIMAIVDGVDIVQWSIKERLQIIFLFAGGDRVDDLI